MRLLSLTPHSRLTPVTLPAQRSPANTGAPAPLEIGALAPDFSLRVATRYGVLANPVRLSDYEGKTMVLAFFYKARTSG
jgi:hypothetical protein